MLGGMRNADSGESSKSNGEDVTAKGNRPEAASSPIAGSKSPRDGEIAATGRPGPGNPRNPAGRSHPVKRSWHQTFLKKSLMIMGLVLFFSFDEFLLIILFFKIGFPRLSILTWVGIAALIGILNVLLALIIYRLLLTRPTTGAEGLVGLTGTVTSVTGRKGKVFVRGETWDAEFLEELCPGDAIKVSEVRGLNLVVDRIGGGVR
jgi:membrane protein implicated in regulation of membrane protease activity